MKIFYCQPDMTSWSVLRQGTLHTLCHDGFGKSDHDFLIVINSHFFSAMHGFRDNEVFLQAGSRHRDFSARFTLFYMTDSERGTMTLVFILLPVLILLYIFRLLECIACVCKTVVFADVI